MIRQNRDGVKKFLMALPSDLFLLCKQKKAPGSPALCK